MLFILFLLKTEGNLFDNNIEPISRLNVWVLDGEVAHKNLLKFAINPETIAHSLAVIVINLSQPWDLVESLTRWLKVLQEHMEKNVFPTLPKEYLEQLRKNCKYFFFFFVFFFHLCFCHFTFQ
jgi:hypothetical protein